MKKNEIKAQEMAEGATARKEQMKNNVEDYIEEEYVTITSGIMYQHYVNTWSTLDEQSKKYVFQDMTADVANGLISRDEYIKNMIKIAATL